MGPIINDNPYSPPQVHEVSPITDGQIAEAMRVTFWPALLMIVEGTLIAAAFTIAVGIDIYSRGLPTLPSSSVAFVELFLNLPYLLAPLLLAPLLIWCGIKMKRIESRGLSSLGAVLSVVLFLPLGCVICLWTIVALNRPVVRDAFRRRNFS